MTPHLDDDERRARLARRHAITPTTRAATVEAAADAMVVLHGTDPAGLFLSAWARVDGFHVKDLERALYEERTLVKHMAMRRTLFAVPRDLLPVVQAAASDRVADTERRRLAKEVAAAGLVDDGVRWLADAEAAVVRELADGPLTTTELRTRVPLLDGSIEYGVGKSWGGKVAVVGRVLTCLSAAGTVVRATNQGAWGTSRPTWALMDDWLGGGRPEPVPEAQARAALVARWLRTFGPATEVDLKWWLGSTLTAVRASLRDAGAVAVDLDGVGTGYVLPDDVDPVGPVEPWVALLPALDPTTMGWFERDWYLGPHKAQIFDSTGNGGATIWVDGRIVGGWTVTPAGDVQLVLLDDVGRDARAAIDAEADRLTAWLDGTTVGVRFPAPLVREPRR
ncbi:winged helix DNA-binding domain-containing protein [Cellulomonas sp.]|uniref:winged helix DNA-binding domain-containing protein n=1 Tax=Cellulomonas sp. TaxID=40001 RepID=UPI001B064301|nr:winged helix DNA-binding domain-containing protein [Cellulomonas sp.]MBO9553568.1 AlkZ family DNA glycosylase [Cellulomonas sp.]